MNSSSAHRGPARAFPPQEPCQGVSLWLRRNLTSGAPSMSTLKVRGHTGSDSISEGPSTMVGGCHVGSASTKSPGDAWRREKVQTHLLISKKEIHCLTRPAGPRRLFVGITHHFSRMETPRVDELGGGGGDVCQRTKSLGPTDDFCQVQTSALSLPFCKAADPVRTIAKCL